MTLNSDTKSSAQLEREVQQQRDRVEARLDEIKHRLSPGQLLDEALSYTRHGGAHFAQNFASQVSANPLPAALVGIGLAWLIGSNVGGNGNGGHSDSRSTSSFTGASGGHADVTYPYANIGTGGVRRVSHSADETGQWWSEFESAAGDRYRARADEHGNRAGHFTDKTGKMFSGFIDDAGNRVRDIRDEAGNMLSDVQGWANHSWHDLTQGISAGLGSVGSAARNAMSGVVSGGRSMGSNLGSTVQTGTEQLSRQMADLLDRQPLIIGALAFAAGAALGATLPHTREEDELIGRPADKLRREAMKTAGDLYSEGKRQAGRAYREVTERASGVYADVKDSLVPESDQSSTTGTASQFRH